MIEADSAPEIEGGDVKRTYLLLGIAVLSITLAVVAQEPAAKNTAGAKSAAGASSAAAAKGKELFAQKCSICHFADSSSRKIGPGLKGLFKRGTFSVNNKKVTTENLTVWIENGDSLMPPFKEVLDAQQIKDVVAYVKTL